MYVCVPVCACTRALRAVLSPECGHSASKWLPCTPEWAAGGSWGQREAKLALVQPLRRTCNPDPSCVEGSVWSLKGEPGMGSQEAWGCPAVSIRLGQLCAESVWLSQLGSPRNHPEVASCSHSGWLQGAGCPADYGPL